MSAPLIVFDNVVKRFDGRAALDGVTLEVNEGELLAVIGRSGSGKTTLLRCVNGLVTPDSGRVLVDGALVPGTDVIELRRKIGYVIQDGGLFPHMTVVQNVAISGRAVADSLQRRDARAHELLEVVGLDWKIFAERYPGQLSGGQRRRVGIARALYADPAIMLLDEPFTALDPLARMEMQEEFVKLRARLRKTILFITHDVEEALYLGDRVAVFDNGKVVQIDTPDALRRNPASEYIRRFLTLRRAMEER